MKQTIYIKVLDHLEDTVLTMSMCMVTHIEVDNQITQLKQMFPYFDVEVEYKQ